MTDEPFRYVEAMANRREYVETQLAGASPVVALNTKSGLLFLTVAPEKQKIFEVYDRLALGAMGHPGDVERLRMTAIEIAGTEGFTRSPADVSLRRLVNYSFSPLLKNAFEQVYGPVFLARLLFAELGATPEENYFVRVEFDGSLRSSGQGSERQGFGVIAGTQRAEELMTTFLQEKAVAKLSLEVAVEVALDAWAVGSLVAAEDLPEAPTDETRAAFLESALAKKIVEAAVLENSRSSRQTYRSLSEIELRKILQKISRKG